MPLKKGIPEAPIKIYADKLYTLEELAGVLRVDMHTIYNYRYQGRIKVIKLTSKALRVMGSEISYLKANGLRPVTNAYRKEAAAVQRAQRAKRKAQAEGTAKAKASHAHTRTRAREGART